MDGTPIATRVSGDTVSGNNGLFYLFTDHLGSSAFMTTSSGTLVAGSTARYKPFGGYRTTPSQTITDRGFTGHLQNDSVGLIYMNARFYLPGVGRFASADTIVPEPGNPQAFNRYSYVYNNPLIYTDPTGHAPTAYKLSPLQLGTPQGQLTLTLNHYNSQLPTPNDDWTDWTYEQVGAAQGILAGFGFGSAAVGTIAFFGGITGPVGWLGAVVVVGGATLAGLVIGTETGIEYDEQQASLEQRYTALNNINMFLSSNFVTQIKDTENGLISELYYSQKVNGEDVFTKVNDFTIEFDSYTKMVKFTTTLEGGVVHIYTEYLGDAYEETEKMMQDAQNS